MPGSFYKASESVCMLMNNSEDVAQHSARGEPEVVAENLAIKYDRPSKFLSNKADLRLK